MSEYFVLKHEYHLLSMGNTLTKDTELYFLSCSILSYTNFLFIMTEGQKDSNVSKLKQISVLKVWKDSTASKDGGVIEDSYQKHLMSRVCVPFVLASNMCNA